MRGMNYGHAHDAAAFGVQQPERLASLVPGAMQVGFEALR